MRRSLSKNEIVKRRPEIDSIFSEGRKYSCFGMKMLVLKNGLTFSRIIVIPVKHYGSSVERNRIRRQVKEIWRNEKVRMTPGLDFAFVVYPGKNVAFKEIQNRLTTLCEKAGLYC